MIHTSQRLIGILFLLNWVLAGAQIIPFTSERWKIEAKGAIIDGYAGKMNTLLLQNGSARITDAGFENGIIEFDLFLSHRRGFPGVLFRMQDVLNYEEFYVRPHLSGMPDAMQYSPVYDGNSAWQLYHDQADFVNNGMISFEMKEPDGYNTVQHFPYDRWLHIRLVVSGMRADVYFDHEKTPTLIVRQLKRETTRGGVGIKAGVSPVYFADFSITPMDHVDVVPVSGSAHNEQNRIMSWQLSAPVKELTFEGVTEATDLFEQQATWTAVKSEGTGLVNLAAYCTRPEREDNTIMAKTIIRSQGAQVKELQFGYSDRVKVYCNGRLLYSGNNSYLTRDYRFLGTIGYFDSVYLPLRDGVNEIVCVVSETFGGWGIQAKLPDNTGLSLDQ